MKRKPFECPYDLESCDHVDTATCTLEIQCKDCERYDHGVKPTGVIKTKIMKPTGVLAYLTLIVVLSVFATFLYGGLTKAKLVKQEPFDVRLASFIARATAPGYSHCQKCGMPWKYVEGHSTIYESGSGTFSLCEKCWDVCGTPEKRLPYYKEMMEMYDYGLDKRMLIERAVKDWK